MLFVDQIIINYKSFIGKIKIEIYRKIFLT